jgi:hypothetical protein
MSELINPNPTVYSPVEAVVRQPSAADDDEDAIDEIDALEVFGMCLPVLDGPRFLDAFHFINNIIFSFVDLSRTCTVAGL